MECWAHKSRQTFLTHGTSNYCAAAMISIPGWSGAYQTENEDKARDFMRRILYLFRNVGGPLKDKFEEGKHWTTSGPMITVHKDPAGRDLNTQMTVLPEGATQWRFEALTLGVLDEFTYNKQDLRSYGAALGCIEGGEGKLAVIFTGAFGSYANKETLAMLSRARRVEGDLGRYIHQTAHP